MSYFNIFNLLFRGRKVEFSRDDDEENLQRLIEQYSSKNLNKPQKYEIPKKEIGITSKLASNKSDIQRNDYLEEISEISNIRLKNTSLPTNNSNEDDIFYTSSKLNN